MKTNSPSTSSSLRFLLRTAFSICSGMKERVIGWTRCSPLQFWYFSTSLLSKTYFKGEKSVGEVVLAPVILTQLRILRSLWVQLKKFLTLNSRKSINNSTKTVKIKLILTWLSVNSAKLSGKWWSDRSSKSSSSSTWKTLRSVATITNCLSLSCFQTWNAWERAPSDGASSH